MALGCIVFGTDVKTNKGDIAVEHVVAGGLLYAWSGPYVDALNAWRI